MIDMSNAVILLRWSSGMVGNGTMIRWKTSNCNRYIDLHWVAVTHRYTYRAGVIACCGMGAQLNEPHVELTRTLAHSTKSSIAEGQAAGIPFSPGWSDHFDCVAARLTFKVIFIEFRVNCLDKLSELKEWFKVLVPPYHAWKNIAFTIIHVSLLIPFPPFSFK